MWRLISDAGMATLAVIEDFDVVKDCSLGLSPRFKPLTVLQFLFGVALGRGQDPTLRTGFSSEAL